MPQVVPSGHEQDASVDIVNDNPWAPYAHPGYYDQPLLPPPPSPSHTHQAQSPVPTASSSSSSSTVPPTVAPPSLPPPGTLHHNLFPASTQAEGRNPFPNIAEPVTAPAAIQFQGAEGVNISGHPQFTNIGLNIGNLTTVNHYGRVHGLKDLQEFVSFAALHDSAEQDPDRRCHPGTRENVLSRLRDWFDNPMQLSVSAGFTERGVAATFFFYRSDPIRNDGNRLFPTLAWQLAFSIPATKNFIIHALDKTPHLPRKDVETQFEQLVAHPFHPTNIASQLSEPAPVVIIDGLDEFKDSLVPLRFLFCSRSEALIEEVLDQFKDFTLHIDLAPLKNTNRDIEKYLVDQFSDIASKRGLAPTWPGPEIIEELVFKFSGFSLFAAAVIRYISDEDCDPQEQLDIVRNLKPHGKMSPFVLLDELYLGILKRQRDQDFLKTFLALLIGRSSINEGDLHEDDAMLMNISEQDLLIKLQTMRSLLKLRPFIDVYHEAFLDFLQDSSRSGQYYNVSKAIKDPDYHGNSHFAPKFVSLFRPTSIAIQLPPQDWEEILHPLEKAHYDLSRKLNRGYCDQCRLFQVTENLLSHLNSIRESASGQRDFSMNFGRLSFGPAAAVGLLLTAFAQR
ncbi:hypothetical protein M378DRAFT_16202 [Amanita muscaria Koide BX008]|uniref:Nephrocystin 3-like N-terminal domain-containing protein n=1 Tax=Amanita muscaria (strain Koide BX008) TaxID=946122 RepID=A0A0C2S4E2_AMAMK|nr:hypothetical protein M378DRAFT_16202 [Amanita muscaria Koide BX008]